MDSKHPLITNRQLAKSIIAFAEYKEKSKLNGRTTIALTNMKIL